MKIIGKRIFLRKLQPLDVTETYLKWMKDKEVTQFLESRWEKQSLEKLKQYVTAQNKKVDTHLLGIFLKRNTQHIGNLKIGNIDKHHRFADIGLIIGEKKLWGKGYATESIIVASKYAFNTLKLNKLIAGIYETNIGSYKAFIKAGFNKSGELHRHRKYKQKYISQILVEKIKS